MKKFFITFTTFFALCLASFVFASGNNNVVQDYNNFAFLMYNDNEVPFETGAPIFEKGNVWVPYHFVDLLGVSAYFDEKTYVLSLNKGGKQMSIYPNDGKIVADKDTFDLEICIQDNLPMLPVKLVAEYYGYEETFFIQSRICRIYNQKKIASDLEIYDMFSQYANAKRENIKTPNSVEVPKTPVVALGKTEKPKEKICYLTFDDGPNVNTIQILNLLKRYNMKATFFMLGPSIRKNPEIVRRIIDEGHGVGIHGMSHIHSQFYADDTSAIREMNAANAELFKIVGFRTSLIRSPYGSVPFMKRGQYQNLKNAEYRLWDWNLDSEDSSRAKFNTESFMRNSTSNIKRLKMPIILLHDKKTTASVLSVLLEWLQENEYKCMPISADVEPYHFFKE